MGKSSQASFTLKRVIRKEEKKYWKKVEQQGRGKRKLIALYVAVLCVTTCEVGKKPVRKSLISKLLS